MGARILIWGPSGKERTLVHSLFDAASGLEQRFESNEEKALALTKNWRPHAVLILGTAGDPKAFVAAAREDPSGRKALMILVAAEMTENSVVEALESGIDEVLSSEAAPKELYWRIVAVLRRSTQLQQDEAPLRSGEIQIDRQRRAARVGTKNLRLSRKEFDLLEIFLRSEGRALTRLYLLQTLWGADDAATFQAVDILVSRLRRKLGSAAKALTTLYGVGYAFRLAPFGRR